MCLHSLCSAMCTRDNFYAPLAAMSWCVIEADDICRAALQPAVSDPDLKDDGELACCCVPDRDRHGSQSSPIAHHNIVVVRDGDRIDPDALARKTMCIRSGKRKRELAARSARIRVEQNEAAAPSSEQPDNEAAAAAASPPPPPRYPLLLAAIPSNIKKKELMAMCERIVGWTNRRRERDAEIGRAHV